MVVRLASHDCHDLKDVTERDAVELAQPERDARPRCPASARPVLRVRVAEPRRVVRQRRQRHTESAEGQGRADRSARRPPGLRASTGTRPHCAGAPQTADSRPRYGPPVQQAACDRHRRGPHGSLPGRGRGLAGGGAGASRGAGARPPCDGHQHADDVRRRSSRGFSDVQPLHPHRPVHRWPRKLVALPAATAAPFGRRLCLNTSGWAGTSFAREPGTRPCRTTGALTRPCVCTERGGAGPSNRTKGST